MSEAGGSFRPVRALVADDLVLCREGLALILTRKQIQVVGVAGDRPELIELVTSRCPDVVLLGFDLPDHELESTIRMLRASSPLTKILVLSRYDDPALVRGALGAGAHGFVTKSLSGNGLVAAIGAVQRDGERGVVSMSRDSLARYGDGEDKMLRVRLFCDDTNGCSCGVLSGEFGG